MSIAGTSPPLPLIPLPPSPLPSHTVRRPEGLTRAAEAATAQATARSNVLCVSVSEVTFFKCFPFCTSSLSRVVSPCFFFPPRFPLFPSYSLFPFPPLLCLYPSPSLSLSLQRLLALTPNTAFIISRQITPKGHQFPFFVTCVPSGLSSVPCSYQYSFLFMFMWFSLIPKV